MGGRLSDVDEYRFTKFLTPDQREKLKTARAYASDQRKKLAQFWREAK